MLKKSTAHLPVRENFELIPQETRKLPPLGHFVHFFLVLRCALEGFHERDVGESYDFGAFEEFPDGVGCEDEADVAGRVCQVLGLRVYFD